MDKLIEYGPAVLQVLGALVIIATIVVRFTPSKEDDLKVQGLAAKFFRFMAYLPTIGINPRTKKLEEAYKELAE